MPSPTRTFLCARKIVDRSHKSVRPREHPLPAAQRKCEFCHSTMRPATSKAKSICRFFFLTVSQFPPYFSLSPHGFVHIALNHRMQRISVSTLNTEYPVEFTAFQKCLDYNDYRFNDCRKTERALLDCWNQKMGYQQA